MATQQAVFEQTVGDDQ